MYQIFIGDDDPVFLKALATQVKGILESDGLLKGRDFSLSAFSRPGELEAAFKVGHVGHELLLLLDVEFGSENGLALARRLRGCDPAFSLVYITAYRDYVYDCFDTRPLSYLLKPVDGEKLASLLREDYRQRYEKSRLHLKVGGKLLSIAYQDICALEACSHRVRIWRMDGEALEWNGPLAKLESELPGGYFCRCHNSFLVNLSHVAVFMRNQVTMANGAVYPVSRRYYTSALKKYFAFLKQ